MPALPVNFALILKNPSQACHVRGRRPRGRRVGRVLAASLISDDVSNLMSTCTSGPGPMSSKRRNSVSAIGVKLSKGSSLEGETAVRAPRKSEATIST